MTFPKHRFKKFIKNVVLGSVERQEVLFEEINQSIQNINLKNMDKVFQTIIKSAVYEFLYMPKTPRKIIIKEYLNASNFF
ncbi:MAG: transcription antitermination factor NusB [Candidatus Pelagibacter sp.]